MARASSRVLLWASVSMLAGLVVQPACAADITARLPSYAQGGRTVDWPLTDSRYGYVARYSLALARELDACPGADPGLAALLRIAPQRVTPSTVEALRQLEACRPQAGTALSPFERFAALDTGQPPPTVLERARVLALRASPLTPDYDRTFWDLTGDGHRRSADPDSLFTWGHWRATAGHGCTLQRVLGRLNDDPQTQPLLNESFEGEVPLLEGMLAKDGCTGARALLRPLTLDPKRGDNLQFALARLAASPRVRQIYDDVFYGPRGVRLAYVENYVQAWKAAGREITEIDAAFFLLRSLQYATPSGEQVRRFVAEAPSARAPWELRRLASRTFAGGGDRSFQTGYDVAYYIDGAGSALGRDELTYWTAQSRLKASDVGLQDRPVDICRIFPLRSCPQEKR
jgi:hypothetical protein